MTTWMEAQVKYGAYNSQTCTLRHDTVEWIGRDAPYQKYEKVATSRTVQYRGGRGGREGVVDSDSVECAGA